MLSESPAIVTGVIPGAACFHHISCYYSVIHIHIYTHTDIYTCTETHTHTCTCHVCVVCVRVDEDERECCIHIRHSHLVS